jgi:nitroreductase
MSMELYEVMRTAFSAREFTDDPVPDDVLERILENARFAPSGGNRQGGRIIIVRDQATKDWIADLAGTAARQYAAQMAAGESPWNTVTTSHVDAATIAATPIPPTLHVPYRKAPVLLVVCVDLRVIASIDKDLDRIGMASGASIYPLAWNILLAARNEGYGGTLTTMPIAEEPAMRELLGIPEHGAVCAVIPLGKPVKQLRKLRRKAVNEFATRERWDGEPFA